MPFLIPILGLLGISAAVFGGEALGNNAANTVIPPKPLGTPGTPGLPWYIPVGITVVGGLLLYKYGAKALKL